MPYFRPTTGILQLYVNLTSVLFQPAVSLASDLVPAYVSPTMSALPFDLPQLHLTSTTVSFQSYFSPTSARHQSYFSSTLVLRISAPSEPYFSSTSTLPLPYCSSTTAVLQAYSRPTLTLPRANFSSTPAPLQLNISGTYPSIMIALCSHPPPPPAPTRRP